MRCVKRFIQINGGNKLHKICKLSGFSNIQELHREIIINVIDLDRHEAIYLEE